MASSFLALPKPFLVASPVHKPSANPSPSPSSAFPGLRRNALRINALAQKFDAAKVVPQADRVLIRLEPLPEFVNSDGFEGTSWKGKFGHGHGPLRWTVARYKSAGGVLLPKSAVKFERYLVGEVLSVGAEVGTIEAGKKVLFSDINAYEVDLGTDGRHCFCKAGDLLAVVE